MTRLVNRSTNLISNIREPVSDNGAVNKKYVDDEVKSFGCFRRQIVSIRKFLREKQSDDVKIESIEPLKKDFEILDKVSNILSNVWTDNTKTPKEISIPDNFVRVVKYYERWTVRTEHSAIQYDIPYNE